MGAHAYMPKEGVEEVVPFLEKILRYENLYVWRRLLENLCGFLGRWRGNGHKPGMKFLQNILQKMDELKRNGLY
jgi:hypothetical protein